MALLCLKVQIYSPGWVLSGSLARHRHATGTLRGRQPRPSECIAYAHEEGHDAGWVARPGRQSLVLFWESTFFFLPTNEKQSKNIRPWFGGLMISARRF